MLHIWTQRACNVQDHDKQARCSFCWKCRLIFHAALILLLANAVVSDQQKLVFPFLVFSFSLNPLCLTEEWIVTLSAPSSSSPPASYPSRLLLATSSRLAARTPISACVRKQKAGWRMLSPRPLIKLWRGCSNWEMQLELYWSKQDDIDHRGLWHNTVASVRNTNSGCYLCGARRRGYAKYLLLYLGSLSVLCDRSRSSALILIFCPAAEPLRGDDKALVSRPLAPAVIHRRSAGHTLTTWLVCPIHLLSSHTAKDFGATAVCFKDGSQRAPFFYPQVVFPPSCWGLAHTVISVSFIQLPLSVVQIYTGAISYPTCFFPDLSGISSTNRVQQIPI